MISGKRGASNSPLGTSWLLLLLAVFLLVAAGPLWQPVFGDEIPLIRNMLKFVQHRTLIPEQFNYPTFYSYALTLAFSVPALAFALVRDVSSSEISLRLEWAIEGTAAVPFEIILLRSFSVFLALATLLLTCRLAHSLCRDRFERNTCTAVSIGAGALLALSSTFVYRATLALPDILLVFLATVVYAVTLRTWRTASAGPPDRARPPLGFYLAAGVSGVAIATKYNGVFVLFLVLLTAIIWRLRHSAGPDSPNAWSGTLGLEMLVDQMTLGLTSVAAFLVASPGWLLAPRDFLAGFQYERAHMAAGQLFVDMGEFPFLWVLDSQTKCNTSPSCPDRRG